MYSITVQHLGADIIKVLVSTGMTAVPTGGGNTQTVAVGGWGYLIYTCQYFSMKLLKMQISGTGPRCIHS